MKIFTNLISITLIALSLISSSAMAIYIGNNSNYNSIKCYNQFCYKYDESDQKNIAIRTGLSFGPYFGYQINNIYVDDSDFINATNGVKSFNFNGTPVGAHIDYNILMNNGLFVGIGYDIKHSLSNRTQNIKFQIPTFIRGNPNATEELTTKLVLKKNLSQAITARFGIANEYAAIDINMAIVRSNFTHGFTITNRIAFIEGYNNKTKSRMGLAPGFGIMIPINTNFSIGFNYRYEIYPKEGNYETSGDQGKLLESRSKDRITSHSMFIKFSYHI